MGNIGDDIVTTVPAVGSAGPTYATNINAILTEVMARLEAKVPLSSVLTNSNLDLNGQSISNINYLRFVNAGVTPAVSPTCRITVFNGDLWYVSPSAAIQLTSGSVLNAAAVGGITGDYSGAGPMQFRYDSANTRYDAFSNQATNTWAYVRGRGFDIAAGATSAIRARLLFAGGSNVSYTLPAAVPAASSMLKMDTAGNITTTPTITRVVNYPVHYCGIRSTGNPGPANMTAGESLWYPLDIPEGAVITAWTLSANKTTNATNTFRANIVKQSTAGVTSAFATQQSNAVNNPGAITLGQSALSLTVAAGDALMLEVLASALSGGGTEAAYHLKVTYNEPAV